MSTALTITAKKDIRTLIQSDAVKQQLALVLPKHLTADRMARVAITAIMRAPKLALCTPESLLNCLMQCSQFGLEPDGRRAHLIPFENRTKGTVECTLILDWKGLAELALRSGMIAKLHADTICEKDEFEFDLGDILHHRINWRESRGEPYAAYAMAVTKTGERFVAVLTRDEIEKIRDNSQGWRAFKSGYAKQSPWQDAPSEMWKKTAFRRLSKWLPLSPEFRDAVEADDEERVAPIKADTFDLSIPDAPSFTPKAIEAASVIGDPQDGDLAPAPSPATPKEKKPTPKAPPEPPVKPQDEPAAPELIPASEPVQEATKAAYTPAAGTLGDLLAAMESEGVTTDQILRFAGKKGVLKEGTDPDLAVMADILESKIPVLAKMIRTKGTALKEMKEG